MLLVLACGPTSIPTAAPPVPAAAASDWAAGPHAPEHPEVVVLGAEGGEDTALRVASYTRFLPTPVWMTTREGNDALAARVPLATDKVARHASMTGYVCERRICAEPTTDPARVHDLEPPGE